MFDFLCLYAGAKEPPVRMSHGFTECSRDRVRGVYWSWTASPHVGIVEREPAALPWTWMTYVQSDANEPVEQVARSMDAVVAVRVERTVHVDLAHETGSVKTLGLQVKSDGMSVDAFADHWNRIHAPTLLNYETKLVRYVTNVVRAAHGPWTYAGLVEQWFRSDGDLVEHLRLAARGRPRVTEDLPQFVGSADILLVTPTPRHGPLR